jgi:hypothetical protein
MNNENHTKAAPVHQLVGQLRELLHKADSVPWVNDGKSLRSALAHASDDIVDYVYDLENAELIVAAVNALPALLAIAEAAAIVSAQRNGPYLMADIDATLKAESDLRAALSLLPNAKDQGADK